MRDYFDTVVCGGGAAGFAAAVASARHGAETALIDENEHMGGDIYYAGIPSMLTFHSKKGRPLVGGIAGELIDGLRASGGSAGHVTDTVGVAGTVTPVSPAAAAIQMRLMCSRAGVKLLCGTRIEGVEADCFGAVKRVRCRRGDDRFSIESETFIDASGCGALVRMAGGRMIDDGRTMPGTLIFNVAGVDLKAVKDYMKANRGEFHFETRFDSIDSCPVLGCSGFFSLFRGSRLRINRDRVLFYQTLSPSEVSVNMTRIPSAMRGDENAMQFAVDQAMKIFGFLKNDVPGFSKSFISYIAPRIGWRELGRVEGLYKLSNSDVAEGRRFDDEIAYGGFPVDIHEDSGNGIRSRGVKGDGFYGIPYRTLISSSCENVLACGKCLSSEFEAHASARVQAVCMATGEAAGTAAAIAVKKGYLPCDLPYFRLRDALKDASFLLIPIP